MQSSVSRAHLLAATVLSAWLIYFLFGSTNGFNWIDSWHNEQRAAQLLLLLVTAATLGVLCASPVADALPSFSWPLWVVVLAGLASSVCATFRFPAVAEISMYTALGGVVMLSAFVFRQVPHSILWFERAVLLLASTHCLGIGVRYAAALSTQGDLGLDVLLLGFANPRFQSALYVLLMPFIAWQALSGARSRPLRLTALTVLVLLWTFNFALGTRAVPFSIGLASIGFGVLVWKRRPLSIIKMLFASLVLGAVLYVLLFHMLPSWLGASGGHAVNVDRFLNSSSRDQLFKLSLEAIWSAPLLGIGPMQFAAIPAVPNAHPHNWVLQLAAEYGVPTAVLVVAGVAVWLSRLRARIPTTTSGGRGLLEPALLMTLVALACGLVDGNLVMPVSQTAAAIGLGALLASLPERPHDALSPVAVPASTLAVVSAAAVVAVYGFASYKDQEASIRHYRHLYAKDSVFAPRFWEQGLLLGTK
jgi:O-antigen ligase